MNTNTQRAIETEQIHQRAKWGGRIHSVAEWLIILEKLTSDARRAWVTNNGDEAALHEIRQIATTAIACMDQCGAPVRPGIAVTAIPDPELTISGHLVSQEDFEKTKDDIGDYAPLEILKMAVLCRALADDTHIFSEDLASSGFVLKSEEAKQRADRYLETYQAICAVWPVQ